MGEIEDEDENDMEDARSYENPVVSLAWLGLEDLGLV
jgi:hypothetical protein